MAYTIILYKQGIWKKGKKQRETIINKNALFKEIGYLKGKK